MRNNPRRSAFFAASATAAAADGPVGFAERVASLPGLAWNVLIGRYDGLSRGRLLLMVVAALYVISPVDLLPEALLTLPGLADDAVVGGWLVASLWRATTAYVAWRGTHPGEPTPASSQVVQGEVVRS